MSKSDYTEYILRFSYGKDSFKCLDVIYTRGLPLDRITTTDVWATDTIPAWLPPMDAFKERAEEYIWTRYRMDVEHLCAQNKDGSKKTYEQMFYHVPQRRSQTVQVERERERERERETGYARRSTGIQKARNYHRVSSKHGIQLLPETQDCLNPISKVSRWQRELPGVRSSSPEFRHQSFPAQISSWCKKLKIDYVRTPFPASAPRGAGKQISWST